MKPHTYFNKYDVQQLDDPHKNDFLLCLVYARRLASLASLVVGISVLLIVTVLSNSETNGVPTVLALIMAFMGALSMYGVYSVFKVERNIRRLFNILKEKSPDA